MITPIKVRRLIEEAGGPSEADKAMRSLFKWDLLQGSKEFIMKPAQWKTIEAEYEKVYSQEFVLLQ